tara:strand:+ start:1370 stop:2230 length:861 start_codon:yes stop_codon:yes gene_type:complete
MELLRADYSFSSDRYGATRGLTIGGVERSKRHTIKADLFLLLVKKDQKAFWRQGKPVSIKSGEVVILNSHLDIASFDKSVFHLIKIPAKKAECFVNEKLTKTLALNLPRCINEWPELLLKNGSLLAKNLLNLQAQLEEMPQRSLEQETLFCQVLESLFNSISLELFWALERLKDCNTASRQELIQKVATVNEFMHSNLAEDLSLEKLADLVGYSHFHFQRQYKSAMGISPTKQLSLWRLNKAIELIRNTDYRLKEIAGLVGYNDLPTFSKAFKRQYGVSPNNLCST